MKDCRLEIIFLKNHTCEEGGAHLKISVWNLLINLKHTTIYLKLLKWAKKSKNFDIYNVVLKDKK